MSTCNVTNTVPEGPASSPPVSVMEVFFPGLSIISVALQQLLPVNLDSYTGPLCIVGLLVLLGKYVYQLLLDVVESYFTSKVYVPYSNEAHDMVIAWVSSQEFAHKARSSLVSVDNRKKTYDNDFNGSQKKSLHYKPWNGSSFFWYKGNLLIFRSSEREVTFRKEEEVSVTCLGRSPAVLKELFDECRAKYLELVENKTTVFEHRDSCWKKIKSRDIRPISTVIMDEGEKTSLLQDIEAFLNPQSRAWYSRRGIPHRRGYLLFGPPGTGKSSLSLSIAGHFGLEIYILNLSTVDDHSLSSLFAELPQRCAILLEDVDAISATHTRETKTEKLVQQTGVPKMESKQVSLSVLLNVLDGVASQEGRVLILTTNHIERLDNALIRPGRVDRKVELGLANKEITSQLFSMVYKRCNDLTDDGQQVEDDDAVEQLASKFANKIPELEFSPAEVLSFLIEHRQSPSMALERVEQWMSRTREEKERIKRVDSWEINA